MPEIKLVDDLNIGDVISVGVPGMETRRWRVSEYRGTKVMLAPLLPDGSVDELSADHGEYWLDTACGCL